VFKKLIRLSVVLAAMLLMVACEPIDWLIEQSPTTDPVVPVEGTLEVYFLDVGQAESILLKTEGHSMLIDAGNLNQDNKMRDYLQKYNVTQLDYLVATHPDADHIGSMATVIRAMDSIGAILMPDVTANTQTFSRLLDAIEEKDLEIINPTVGYEFMFGEAKVEVMAPKSPKYSDTNDYSIVLRLVFGNKTFLFTGDAEAKSENEQLAAGLNLKADVLKVAHHGSSTSSSQAFLDIVNPTIAVISCGTGNSYGHPRPETISRLDDMGVIIYRTDLLGTITITTDGSSDFVISYEN